MLVGKEKEKENLWLVWELVFVIMWCIKKLYELILVWNEF